MVKRSRAQYCSSGGGADRRGVVVTFGVLVLYILLCGSVVLGSPPGDWSLKDSVAAIAPERKLVGGDGWSAEDVAMAAGTAARTGRSSDGLSHIVGTARKIKMFIRHRYLQLFLDGTVNSTYNDTSDYVILQRTSVNLGQLKIQGVATCMYLCLDACGLLYGSKDFVDECVFNEMIEQDHYNTYSSAKYSDDSRTLYLAINKGGMPRQVQVKANAPLGKLSKSTHVLTQPVPPKTVDRLLATRGPVIGEWPDSIPHAHRHHHACPPHVGPPLAANRHRKSSRKCQAKTGGGKKSRKKNRDETASKDREDDDGGVIGVGNKKNNRCGNDETSHRKVDAAGRKKKSKKLTVCGGGKGSKPHRQILHGKAKKSESDLLPESVAVVQTVTTVVIPSLQTVDGDGDDDDDDDDTPGTTAPLDDESSS